MFGGLLNAVSFYVNRKANDSMSCPGARLEFRVSSGRAGIGRATELPGKQADPWARIAL